MIWRLTNNLLDYTKKLRQENIILNLDAKC